MKETNEPPDFNKDVGAVTFNCLECNIEDPRPIPAALPVGFLWNFIYTLSVLNFSSVLKRAVFPSLVQDLKTELKNTICPNFPVFYLGTADNKILFVFCPPDQFVYPICVSTTIDTLKEIQKLEIQP